MPSEMTQIKSAQDELLKDWNEFKKENDDRLKKLETRGSDDPLAKEKLEKINKSLDDLMDRQEKLSAAINRVGVGDKEDDQKSLDLEAKKAMEQFMRKGRMTPELEAKYFDAAPEFKELAVSSDQDGGYFVRPAVSSRIMTRIFESSPIRQLANVETISVDALEIAYDDDEPDSGWVAEISVRPETGNAKVAMLRIPTHELQATPKATTKILQDSAIDIEAWHEGKVRRKFARDEAKAFVSGDGVTKPRGILTYPTGTGTIGTIEQVNSGAAATVTGDGLVLLQNALFEEFQSNAEWLMRRSTAGVIRTLKNQVDGTYLWDFTTGNGLTNGMAKQSLLGRPVNFAADMPALDAGNLAVAYGDFSMGYTIVDRIGIRVLRDPYTQKGFVKFYTTKRVGGDVSQFQAIKLQVCAS